MKKTIVKPTLPLLMILTLISACSYIPTFDEVAPDKRKEYRKSRSLPDLEVPPDLTLDREDDRVIPGEAEPATLSAFELQKKRGGLSQLESLEKQYPGEKILPVPGDTTDVWPDLVTFFKDKSYDIDIQDAELGVLETRWLENGTDESNSRDKFKIFAEPSESGNSVILFISSERQEKIGLGETNIEWLDQKPNERKTNLIVSQIKTLFYGAEDVIEAVPAGTTVQSQSSQVATKRAILEDAGDDKFILKLPENFTSGWAKIAELLDRSGAQIQQTDSAKGLYYVAYLPVDEREQKEKKGFFSRLKFWGDDEAEPAQMRLSVTGIDGNTEIIALDEDGDWESSLVADELLESMKDFYNR